MQRHPRGGKKVNYTLSIPTEMRQNIKDRAKSLDMTEGFYLSTLVDLDLASNLASPAREAEISVAPTTEITTQESSAFSDKVSENRAATTIPLPQEEDPQKAKPQPAPPTIARPQMRSIQDLQREMTGPVTVAQSGNVRDPGMPEGAARAAGLDPNWQQRLHSQLSQGEGSDNAFRRQVLENLPPKSEVKKDEA